MEGQITLNEWMQWREDIRTKLQETASNFVYIGYRLKQIRDSGMYDGCADIFEFAQKEYGLGESTVSRFIAINEKFSEGGNSLELRNEYKALGSSKLAEMLTLSDADCKLIVARTTVKEIRDIKHFNKQTPETVEGDVQYTPLQKCIIDFFKERKEVLNEVVYLLVDGWQVEEAVKTIVPGEYITHKKGIIYLFMYEYRRGVAYKTMGQASPMEMSWESFMSEVAKLYEDYYDDENPNKTHSNFYHIDEVEIVEEKPVEITENKAVATSQQDVEKEVEKPVKEVEKSPNLASSIEEKNITENSEKEVDSTEDEEQEDIDEETDLEAAEPMMDEEQEEPAPMEAEPVPEQVAAEPERASEKERAERALNYCLDELRGNIFKKNWEAARATIKHMEHYLEVVIAEEEEVQ